MTPTPETITPAPAPKALKPNLSPALKQRLITIARWVAYPTFYLFCLALFGYLTFPYDQLKGRLIAEFDRVQAKSHRRPGEPPMRLEISELDGYWLTGIEVEGAKLIVPPKKKSTRGGMGLLGPTGKEEEDPTSKPSVISIDWASARVKMLPLLIGNVMIAFGIEAFGGEINGSMPLHGDGDIDVELDALQLAEIGPLRALIEGLPVLGVLSGKLTLTPKEGKFGKADGKLELHLDDVVIADGKAEVQGVVLPAAQIGSLVLEATAQDGVLTIDEMSARGRDLELIGEGKIKLHEAWERSQADIYVKFKFADAYRDKSDATKALLGDSEGKIKPMIELDPRSPFKRAKTDDGYYRFQLSGPLGDLEPRPAGKAGAPGSKRAATGRTGRLPGLGGKIGIPKAEPGAGREDGEAAESEARPAPQPAPEPPAREPEAQQPREKPDGADEKKEEQGEEAGEE